MVAFQGTFYEILLYFYNDSLYNVYDSEVKKMENLDLSMVKIVQEKAKEREILQNLYQNSIQNGKMQQEVHGKGYVGKQGKQAKENIKPLILTLAAAVGLTASIATVSKLDQVSHYNTVLEQKMEQELTDTQIAAYQKDQDMGNLITNTIEKLGEIQAAKETLDTSNYDVMENNISASTIEYLPLDEDGLFPLSEKDQDAIDIATDQVIEEYKSRGR